jgi:hypothetical protein
MKKEYEDCKKNPKYDACIMSSCTKYKICQSIHAEERNNFIKRNEERGTKQFLENEGRKRGSNGRKLKIGDNSPLANNILKKPEISEIHKKINEIQERQRQFGNSVKMVKQTQ